MWRRNKTLSCSFRGRAKEIHKHFQGRNVGAQSRFEIIKLLWQTCSVTGYAAPAPFLQFGIFLAEQEIKKYIESIIKWMKSYKKSILSSTK